MDVHAAKANDSDVSTPESNAADPKNIMNNTV